MTGRVMLAHGNGGRFMRELIDEVFVAAFGDEAPDSRCDAAALPAADGELMITTDGFTVQPLEFPGGNLGSLAAHGTINDLAVAGAEPRWLTLGVILEEGLEIACLRRIVDSFAREVRAAGARRCSVPSKRRTNLRASWRRAPARALPLRRMPPMREGLRRARGHAFLA